MYKLQEKRLHPTHFFVFDFADSALFEVVNFQVVEIGEFEDEDDFFFVAFFFETVVFDVEL